MCEKCVNKSKREIIDEHKRHVEWHPREYGQIRFTRNAYHELSAKIMDEFQHSHLPEIRHPGYSITELMKRIEKLEQQRF